jgi:hypothetical protein
MRKALIEFARVTSLAAWVRGPVKIIAAVFLPLHRNAPCAVGLNIRAIRTMLLAVIVSLKC